MADSYWIDVYQGSNTSAGRKQRSGGKLGADDYAIGEGVGGHGGSGRSGYHHRGSRWQTPLFYVIDNTPVGVTVTADNQDIPDEVTGTGSDRLLPGESMRAQNGTGAGFAPPLLSSNKRARLFLQADSNLVLYDGPPENRHPLWATGVAPSCNTLTMQKDGNLVLLNSTTGHVGWSSNTAGHPGGYLRIQDDGNIALYDSQGAYWAIGTNGFRRATGTPWYRGKKKGGFLSDAVHVFNSAASFAGHAIGSLPVVGPLAAATAKLNPIVAIGGLASSVASGERLDHAFLNTAKSQIAAAREIAPYAQMVTSLVPGVGTGVAAAIAAGTALSEGRTITDAALEAIKGAIPGGPMAKTAFNVGDLLAHGDKLNPTVIANALSQLPPEAQAALKAVTMGKADSKTRAIQAVRAALPQNVRHAVDIGIATGVARNIQSATVNAVKKSLPVFAAHGAIVTKAVPHFAELAKHQLGEQRKGYDIAMGLLGHRGISAQALASARDQLSSVQKEGFDRAVKAYADHFTPNHPSLVHRGLVLRGNWVPARSGEKNAVVGRLIQSGKVTHGVFKRA